MSVRVTAKVRCTFLETPGGGGPGTTTVQFAPDYTDGRNKEWAAATPALTLQMTVKDPGLFESGADYTLTFEREE